MPWVSRSRNRRRFGSPVRWSVRARRTLYANWRRAARSQRARRGSPASRARFRRTSAATGFRRRGSRPWTPSERTGTAIAACRPWSSITCVGFDVSALFSTTMLRFSRYACPPMPRSELEESWGSSRSRIPCGTRRGRGDSGRNRYAQAQAHDGLAEELSGAVDDRDEHVVEWARREIELWIRTRRDKNR